jgi:nitroreductase
MSEKRGRGQPKFEPTQDQRNQVKMMKALGIPEDRICTTITNPRTGIPVAPMTLARAFAPELIHEAPVWIVPCLEGGTPTRTSGSSIYPAVQNMLLAARALGLGATLRGGTPSISPGSGG